MRRRGGFPSGEAHAQPFCLSFHVSPIAAYDLSDFGLRIEYFIEDFFLKSTRVRRRIEGGRKKDRRRRGIAKMNTTERKQDELRRKIFFVSLRKYGF